MAAKSTLESVVEARALSEEEASRAVSAAAAALADAERAAGTARSVAQKTANALGAFQQGLEARRQTPTTIGALQDGYAEERRLEEQHRAHCEARTAWEQALVRAARDLDHARELHTAAVAALRAAETTVEGQRERQRRAGERKDDDEADELAGIRSFLDRQR